MNRGYPLALAAVAALAGAAALRRRGSVNATPRYTVSTPQEGRALIASKVYTDNWREALEVEPHHKIAVLVPCAGTKPFSEAPSHKHGYMPALEGLAVDRWVVAEPLGVVPWAWERRYPNDAYNFPPDQLRGAGRTLLVERIRAWLDSTGREYDALLLALPGHHGDLVQDAAAGLDLPLVDLSISACRRSDGCDGAVYRATSPAYRRWLRREVEARL